LDRSSDCPLGSALRAIAKALDLSVATIERVRQQFVELSLEAALNRKAQTKHKPRRLDGDGEAHLVAITCSSPPCGSARWTLRLLAQRLVELEEVESISHETIRQTLKKTNLNQGLSRILDNSPRSFSRVCLPHGRCT